MKYRCQSCGIEIEKEGQCESCKELEKVLKSPRTFSCRVCGRVHLRDSILDAWMNGLCCNHWEEKNNSGLSLDKWLEEFRNNYKSND